MLKNTNHIRSSSAFKDHRNEKQILASRSMVAFVLVIILMLLLLSRGWYLQVIRYDDYQTRSNNNRISVQRVAPNRGLIYDRNGVLLAENRSIYSLEVIPEQATNLEQELRIMLGLGLIAEEDILRFNKRLKGKRRFKSVVLKSRLTEKEVAIFSVNGHQLKGVHIEARLVRYYPFGEKIVHAIGSVRQINDQDLKRIDQANYKATRYIGKVGLEKYYEPVLHGKIGSRTVEIDVQGRVIGQPLNETPPIPGHNLRLSIDINIQLAATKAIEDFRGSVIVVDPRNGEILALVSNPGYDPNEFVTGISQKAYNKLINSKAHPLFNRALRGLYSPGSTIKPMLAFAGLQSKTITKNTSIKDPGYWVIPNKEERIYRDWTPRGHDNKVKVAKAITQSCDPFFYDLAYKMGIDLISKSMAEFGFGESTGIDMGEELTGIMPSRQWKKTQRGIDWFPGETVITGIGQGYWNATPLQLVNAIAVLANGKHRYNLRLVTSEKIDGKWVDKAATLAKKQVDFGDGKNLKIVRKAMEEVTRYPWGTAKKAFAGASYQSAGKTGTVQLRKLNEEGDYDTSKIEKKYHDNAIYVGYAPIKDPEVAIVVVAENGGHGGESAAPVARKVFDAYFNGSAKP